MDTAAVKKQIVAMWGDSFGNVTTCIKAVGIARSTFYNWVKDDAEFAAALEDCQPSEQFLDYLELRLTKLIERGDTAATIFALKTKGKKRGYIERQELTGADDAPPIQITISDKI